MTRLYLQEYENAVHCVRRLGILSGELDDAPPNHWASWPLNHPENKLLTGDWKAQLIRLQSILQSLGLRMSERAAARALETFDHDWTRIHDLEPRLAELYSRMVDEFEGAVVFAVDPKLSAYLDSPPESLFGRNACDAFPGCIPDMSEAAKCLALERATASVFHLMRIMEAALKSFARESGIPYAPSWESYIRQLKTTIESDWSSKSAAEKAKQPFYKEVLGDLQAIKIAWRNPTMHILRKYDPDEAGNIFSAVRALIQSLAAHGVKE